ncbi:RNA 2',3'-cyclic phosphodiesterase [Stutzerimonas azotifigens]|uniref:RNA 2',3'-cyclic phosphodiesterase n=1 Tax=Stutzerimonas azotifigens TaxID=291995 RepID=UPI000422B272|nr:RNA 2',3'-cyclic phosphodiesterase [Stutzerimonas azotifigens]
MPDSALRLFFALPCPPALAAEVCAWRDRLAASGRPVRRDNLHVTLAFLGSQPANRLPALYELAARQSGEPFTLHFDRLERWRSGPLVLTCGEPPAALMVLAARLQAALAESGVTLDARPYRPHLTLMRDARPFTGVEPDFSLAVERFALYRSEQGPDGVRYACLRDWPLAPPAGA